MILKEQYEERKKWFADRIGQRLYRNNYCTCDICKAIYEHGIVITDKDHSIYCHDHEILYTADGKPMRYFETRQEMLDFEKSIPNNEST